MEPQEYLKILRRWWWVVVGLALVATAIGFVTTPPPGERVVSSGTSYSATTTFIVDPSRDVVPLSIERAAFFATTGIVPERVARRVGFEGTGAQLAAEVTATGDPALGTLQITTTQPEPDRAVQVARLFGEELVAFLDEQGQQTFENQVRAETERIEALESDLAEVEAAIDPELDPGDATTEDMVQEERRRTIIREISLGEQRLAQLSTDGPTSAGLIVLEEPAAIPISTGGGFAPPTDAEARVPLFGAFGLVLGVLVALVAARFDTRLRARAEIEQAYSLPVLDQIGLIPRSVRDDRQLLSLHHPGSAMAEDYRALRATFSFLLDDLDSAVWGGRVIAVTSAIPGEGKSTTVANVAAAVAEHGDRVIVVNADFRRTTANQLLSVRGGSGLAELLARGGDIDRPSVERLLRSSPVPGIRVLTQGQVEDHPASLLRNFNRVVAELRELADVVLIDTAPVLAVSDIAEIVPSVDLVAVVCRVGKVRTGLAVRTGEVIKRAKPTHAGVVLVGATSTISGYAAYGDHAADLDESSRSMPATLPPRESSPSEPARTPEAVGE